MKILTSFLEWWKRNINKYKLIFFDVDGTLISGNKRLPNSKELISLLRKKKFPFYLLTNDGNHSPMEKSQLIRKAGIEINSDEVVSCAMAINSFVSKHNMQNKIFFVMGSLGNPCYAELAGLQVCRNTAEIDNCTGIIVGEGTYNWQENINAVINTYIHIFWSLSEKNIDLGNIKPMLVPNPDSYWPNGEHGEIGIGAGGKARFICSILKEMGIILTPVYLGKPYMGIFEYTYTLAHKRFPLIRNIKKSEIIMIGDSLTSDIKGANNFGIHSALVLTGITMEQQIFSIPNEIKPDFIFKHL